jgi:DNA-binding transcriptional LysR family regulator
MKTEDIRLFQEICKNKSINKTAIISGISQQGLSNVVKRLENEMGKQLFVRGCSGVVLTEYGDNFLAFANSIQKDLNELYREFDNTERTVEQNLNIAVSFGVLSSLPDNYWDDFTLRYPKIKINIKECNDKECEQRVLDGSSDLGFNIAPINTELFYFDKIITNKVCALVHKDHRLASKDVIDFVDLKNEKLLMLNKDFKLRKNVEQYCLEVGFTPNIVLETMELILIHNFSKQNKGIGISVYFVSHDIPDVKAIPFSEKSLTWDVCVITSKTATSTEAADLFLKYINTRSFHQIL